MRSLLKTNDRRRLELIELLVEASDWKTTEEISAKLDCSTRILKEDIAFLRENVAEMMIETSHEGIRLFLNNGKAIKDYYRRILKENLPFQILELIFFDETLMIKDLTEQLHVSPSTIYRTVSQINDYFSENHQAYIESNPYRFVGNENFIRNFYRVYFMESCKINEWPFPQVDEEELNQNLNRIINLVAKDVYVDFAYYRTAQLILSVNLIRYNHGHLIETTDYESPLFKIFFAMFKPFLIPKGSSLVVNGDITTEYIYQVCDPYTRPNMIYGKNQFEKLRAKNAQINDAVSFLEAYLRDFSMKIDIPINLDEIILSLVGTIALEEDDPNSKYILYNRNKFFVQHLNKHFPIVTQHLYEGIVTYRKRLRLDLHPDKINMLVYTLFTYWDNLLTDLYRRIQKVSLLILSDGHFSHAKMIKNLLTFELRNNINIDIYQDRELTADKLNHSDYDLFISTFSLDSLTDKEVIVINHFPTSNDILMIQNTINQIINHKKENYSLIEDTKLAVNY